MVDAMKRLQTEHPLRGRLARGAYLLQIVFSLVATAIAAVGPAGGAALVDWPAGVVWAGFVLSALFLLLEAYYRTSRDAQPN